MPPAINTRNAVWRIRRCAAGAAIAVLWLGGAATAGHAAEILLTPVPRHLVWTDDRLDLGRQCTIVAGGEEAATARVLAAEMRRLHGLTAVVAGQATAGPRIILALDDSPVGRARLPQLADPSQWPPPRNSQEGYLLHVDSREAVVVARSPRGLLYGCQTLLQVAEPAASGQAVQLRGVRIVDYPQLAFRGVHLCIFPNTELAAIRQAILLAARYKYNAVVIEPWASLQSAKHPETAYEHAYTPEQMRPLVRLGQTLHMDVIPMLNSWGHASGMRRSSHEHVVLDRFPQFRGLYDADGWAYSLSSPAAREQLFDRYTELLNLFAPVRYFHVGLDEAWGTSASTSLPELQEHLRKIHEFFAGRKVQVLMWHDMFLQSNHPGLGRVSPANSRPPLNSYQALNDLPRDVVIAAWNYDETREWPVPEYFHRKGYRVVVCPWKNRENTVALLNTAKRLELLGVLATTWDSLDVCLPSLAQAGVLAWTGPEYQLQQIPFDHWLAEIRKLPICDLPKLESP